MLARRNDLEFHGLMSEVILCLYPYQIKQQKQMPSILEMKQHLEEKILLC